MESISQQSSREKAIQDRFKDSLIRLLPALLKEHCPGTAYLITGRVKDEASSKNRLTLPADQFSSVNDIVPRIRVTIICYVASDIKTIGKVIDREFQTNPGKVLDIKSFANAACSDQSFQYIVRLREDYYKQAAYQAYKDLSVEIQVQSILYHTWAESIQNVGYPSPAAIPHELQENFSSLLAFVAATDSELTKFKKELLAYKNQELPFRETSANQTALEVSSLESLFETNEVIAQANEILTKYTFISDVYKFDYKTLLRGFTYLGLKTIVDVETALCFHRERYLRFLDIYCFTIKDELKSGWSARTELGYFQYYLIAKVDNTQEVIWFFDSLGYGISDQDALEYIKFYRLSAYKFLQIP